jgi:hypothetical protein
LYSREEFQARREHFCQKALAWVKANLAEFDPGVHRVNQNLRLKALSELLFTCSLYRRRFGRLPSPLDGFVAHGVEATRRTDYVDSIHRKPELVLPYSMIYKSLRDCGTELGDLKDAIQSMLDIGLPMATEDNPYRKMELRYALEGGGFRRLPPPVRTLFGATSLHTSLRDAPPVLSFKLDHVYGLTHAVFYLTDFGLSARGRIPDASSLRWLVTAMLGLQTLERNWDAVAELLLCCDSLGYFPSAVYRQAWGSLLEAQKGDGSLTDNFFDAKRFESMGDPERSRYYFEQHYHTTIVCAAAAFLADAGSPKTGETILAGSTRGQRRDCAGQVGRARDWMLRTYEELQGALDLPSLLYLIVGHWGAAAALGSRRKGSRAFYARVHRDLLRTIRGSPTSVDGCDPALALLGEGILRKAGLGVPAFERLAKDSAAALEGYDPSADKGLRLFPVAHLLGSLGFEVRMWADGVEVDDGIKAPESFQSLANYVSQATSFGSREFRPRNARLAEKVRADLTTLAFHHFHHYRLEEGFLLVRAMNHAGMNGWKPFKEAIDFALAQQKEDGSFGFYAEEARLIRKSDPGFDPLVRTTLPVTVSAIWTAAEATVEGFSLFNSIRR